MFVRMKRMHDYVDGSGLKRRIPAGWIGALDDEIARKAIEGGIADEIEGDAAMAGARDPAALPPTPAPPPLTADFAKFDHDGDGRPGGALPRSSRRDKKD